MVKFHSSALSIPNGGSDIYYSKEFAGQYKKKNRHSVVQPRLMNEPELFIPVKDVIYSFFDAEESIWKKIVNSPFPIHQDSSGSFSSGGISPLGSSYALNDIPDTASVNELTGEAFLRHGKSLQDIHQYFIKLDPRRCCVNCKKVEEGMVGSAPLKVVKEETHSRRDSKNRGNKSLGSTRNRERTVKQLNPQDEKIYMQLLKCAYHPPLDEPTPSPHWNRGDSQSDATKRYHQFSIDSAVSIERNMLITKLQRAFHVNTYLHDRLKNELVKVLQNQDFSAALASNLMDQLSRLECNGCTFYQSAFFANGDFYEEWRREEINFVNRLLKKWYPNHAGIRACILQSFDGHEAFKVIVKKFLSLDLNDKSESASKDSLNRTVTSILTTASRKLLNEFCMWYGVGGIFRQLAILNAMVENIIFSDWYLQCLLLGLEETLEFVLERQNYLVRQERKFAENILNRLTYQIEYGFIKLFSLYQKFLSGDGIQTLFILLQQVLQAKRFFSLTDERDERSLENLAKQYIELASIEHYNLSKGLAEHTFELKEGAERSTLTPETLRLTLQAMKLCVAIAEDISSKCPLLLQMCPALVDVVAKKLYSEFMKDIKELCFLNTDTIEFSVVDYEMMGLAYRLDKLDKDWRRFIPPENQKWRRYFKIVLAVSLKAISEYLLAKITEYITKDDLEIIQLDKFLQQLSKSKCSSPYQSSMDYRRTIKHSDNSAFTSVKSVSPYSGLSNIKSLRNLLQRGSAIGVECKLNNPNTLSDRMSSNSSHSISRISDDLEDEGDGCRADDLENEEDGCRADGFDISRKSSDCGVEINDSTTIENETSNELQYCIDDRTSSVCKHLDISDYEGDGNRIDECSDEISEHVEKIGKCVATTKHISNDLQYKMDDFTTYHEISDDYEVRINEQINPENRIAQNSENSDTVKNVLEQLLARVLDRVLVKNSVGKSNVYEEGDFTQDSVNLENNSNRVRVESVVKELVEDIANAVSKSHDDNTQTRNNESTLLQNGRYSNAHVETLDMNISYCRKTSGNKPSVDNRYIEIDVFVGKKKLSRSWNSEPLLKDSYLKLSRVAAAASRYVTEGPSIDNCYHSTVDSLPDIRAHTTDAIWQRTIYKPIAINSDNGIDKTTYTKSGILKSKSTSIESFQSLDNFQKLPLHDLPNNGQILITSSLTDLLISCSRLISFASVICSIVLPLDFRVMEQNNSDCNKEKYELRMDILQKVMVCVGELVESYATNMISLDDCGSNIFHVQKDESKRRGKSGSFDGQKNGVYRKRENIGVDRVIKSDFIVLPGCRHKKERVNSEGNENGKPCPLLKYLLNKSLGNWELITKEMCFRINNVYSLIKVMPVLQKRAVNSMNIDMLKLLVEIAPKLISELNCHEGCPCMTPGERLCYFIYPSNEYLREILHLQIKLLSCRVMDIFTKLFIELKTLPQRGRSICEHMKSCLEYLRCQMKFFRHALYEQCVQLVAVEVSKQIVEKFHDLLDDLYNLPDNPCAEALKLQEILLCAIKYLDADKSLEAQINEQMKVVLFRLQLFTLPLDKLKHLFGAVQGKKKQIPSVYLLEELIYLVKQELDKDGKPSFSGCQLVDVLITNEHLLKNLVTLLEVDEDREVRINAHAVASCFLNNKIMRCCSVLERTKRHKPLERICAPNSLPVNIPKAFLPDMDLTLECTPDELSPSNSFLKRYDVQSCTVKGCCSSFISTESIFSEVSSNHREEPQPYVGSDVFFPRNDVLYCFLLDDETPDSLLLTGELYNMIREEGRWLEVSVKNDIISRFSHAFRVNRTSEIVDFFKMYGIQPLHVRRLSCLW